MMPISSSKALLATMMVAASVVALSTIASRAETPKTCVTGVDMAKLGPTTIIGQGPNGEKAASVDELKLTDDEIAKVKAGKFKVGITMQTVNLDWSQLQVAGVTDTLSKYGVEVIGVASAEYQVDKQIADMQDRLAVQRISLQQEFTAADQAMTQLKSQSGTLSSMSVTQH